RALWRPAGRRIEQRRDMEVRRRELDAPHAAHRPAGPQRPRHGDDPLTISERDAPRGGASACTPTRAAVSLREGYGITGTDRPARPSLDLARISVDATAGGDAALYVTQLPDAFLYSIVSPGKATFACKAPAEICPPGTSTR